MSSTAISKTQIQGYVAAWLGWAFDGLDSVLYTLVALPFVTQLVGAVSDPTEPKKRAALIQGFFMFGWALGGAVFGRVGDRIGRTRTLTLTILIYALFTGLSAFAHEWWHLLIFRFIAALGIGGEWAAGSSLVSETMHPKHKAWASALLQTGLQAGMIMASITVIYFPGFLVSHGWASQDDVYRWVFVVGASPALLTFWIRKAVPEPEAWHEARKGQEMPKISDLFAPSLRVVTLKVLVFLALSLTSVWTFIFFAAQIIQTHPEVKDMKPTEVQALVGHVTIVYLLWNVAGNFFATYLAKGIGIRNTLALLCGASLAIGWLGFGVPHPLVETEYWIYAMSFAALGLFGLFPLYIPPLFPTLLRTTGSGFCYNIGRLAAGVGTIFAAQIVKSVGAGKPVAIVGSLFAVGLVLSFFMPEAVEGA